MPSTNFYKILQNAISLPFFYKTTFCRRFFDRF